MAAGAAAVDDAELTEEVGATVLVLLEADVELLVVAAFVMLK